MRGRIAFFLLVFPMFVTAQTMGVLDYEVTATLEGDFVDLDVGPDGRVYLLGAEERGVVRVFGPELGRSLAVFDLSRSLGRKMENPAGIAVDDDGSFWVTDHGTGIIFHFDALGFPFGEMRWPQKGPITLKSPDAITLTQDRNLVVTDRENAAVLLFDQKGELLQYIEGSSGRGILFRDPIDIAVDPVGYLYVVDGKGGGICRLDPTGILRHRWGGEESGRFRFPFPTCSATDQRGLCFIVDGEEGRCLVLGESDVVATFATPGDAVGQIQTPVAVAVATDGQILVVDKDPGRVQKYSVPALADLRRNREPEDSFLSPRFDRGFSWQGEATRIDIQGDTVVLLGSKENPLLIGDMAGYPESIRETPIAKGILDAPSDLCMGSDEWVYVADEGLRSVVAIDLDTGDWAEVPSPSGRWRRPTRVARAGGQGLVVWDDGDNSLSFVLGDGEDSWLPVRLKEEVVDVMVMDETGDVILVPARGGAIRMGPSGPMPKAVWFHEEVVSAAAIVRTEILLGYASGGMSMHSVAGEQLLFSGVRGGEQPLVDRFVDFAVQDSALFGVYKDGSVGSYVVNNIDRSGLTGVLDAPEGRSIRMILEPIGSEYGGRHTTLSLSSGALRAEGIMPGVYQWRVEGDGLQTLSSDAALWLRPRRVADLDVLKLRPAGHVVGTVSPPGAGATVHIVGPDSSVYVTAVEDDGSFTVTGLTPGAYTYYVTAAGFKAASQTRTFAIRAGAKTEIPLVSLTKLGNLKGIIKPLTDDEEVWVLRDGRLVSVCRPEPYDRMFEESGDSLGRYSCEGLEPAEYKLLFRARGFYPDTLLTIVALSEGGTVRCGVVILRKTPPDSIAQEALQELQRAVEDYAGARFSSGEARLRRLLSGGVLPYGALERATTLLGWCAIAQGGEEKERLARQSFRMGLLVNPWIEPGPEASPRVTSILEDVRQRLFGDTGPPEGLFRP
jgi:DNA-binding beta-propeller fold protein YncE